MHEFKYKNCQQPQDNFVASSSSSVFVLFCFFFLASMVIVWQAVVYRLIASISCELNEKELGVDRLFPLLARETFPLIFLWTVHVTPHRSRLIGVVYLKPAHINLFPPPRDRKIQNWHLLATIGVCLMRTRVSIFHYVLDKSIVETWRWWSICSDQDGRTSLLVIT